MRVKSTRWVLLRNALIAFQFILYYAALPSVALSVAAASIYTMPLIVSVLAVLFLSENGGWKVWAGVLIGYAGVLLIVQPQHDVFNYYVFLPLGAALLAALSNLVTKSKCVDEHPVAVGFNLNLMLLGIGVVASVLSLIWSPSENNSATVDFLLRDWKTMSLAEYTAITVMAIAFGVGSIATTYAYQVGPIAKIATLDFTYIAFTLLWGVVLFAEIPTTTIALGIVLITIAGMLVVRKQVASDIG